MTTLLDEAKKSVRHASRANSDEGNKYLTFKLADEEYGVEILKVREIVGLMNITSVPRKPTCMKGVISLRGQGHPRGRPRFEVLP